MLLGCDYLDPVRGVGPKKALKLIQDHKTLERILDHLKQADDSKKAKASDAHESDDDEATPIKKRPGGIQVPDFWPFREARELFLTPEVQDGHTVQVCIEGIGSSDAILAMSSAKHDLHDRQLKWEQPKTEELVSFLCGEKGFRYVCTSLA